MNNGYKQSLYAAIIRIVANLIMLGAIFLAMYQAWHAIAWPTEAVFFAWFLGITIPTWIIAIFLTRWIRKRYPAEQQTLIMLPRLGKQLVTWKVIDPVAKKSLSPR